ncbi:hypothetical protein ACQPUR_06500 [Clostridium neonatale]|uniref:hypothetical protein n=1 Tax=Clostridium neonatale TaxID=137838 RepID=UPI003D34DCA1
MLLDGFDSSNSTQNLKSKCKKYLYYNVTLIMSDGSIFDGMIENIDQDRIVMLVGEDVIDLDDDESNYDGNRQHENVGFHRRPRRRFRRFRRRFFPFANVAALELLPFFPPHPYLFY